ncbi:MAG: hypothetical protein GX129_07620 [Clostridiales bacterium]|jgi:hypothetical protein|nr:hypothetical protein [Clostridiales bacterium]
MKKQLNISWDGVQDATGYLFSFAKSLSTAVKNSPYSEKAEDIIATSGFAFRMWLNTDLCPSATSIWSFDGQKPWVEKGGLICDYVGRYWGQKDIEKEKRLEAIKIIKASIDRGIPAVSWDIGVPEWGLITGYDDDTQMFSTLAINAEKADPTSTAYNSVLMPYDSLGKRELPLLSVLTITGNSDKTKEDILHDTMKLAVSHLKGEEWCDNTKGLDVYPALIKIFEEDPNLASSWNAEYFLGTYGALKEYAYKYFEKVEKAKLTKVYKAVFHAWIKAFKIKTNEDTTSPEARARIVSLLKSAYEEEKKAVHIMESHINM